jgi:DNA polymerase-3 subunit delta'
MYFRKVIGLNDVKQHLIDSVHRGFVPHARIFYGPEGVGKLPLAIAYARYLNCSSRGVSDACGECPSCHKFDKLAHPDLHFVFPVVKSKTSDDYLPKWRNFLMEHIYFNLNSWLSYIDAENAQGTIYSKESDEIIRKLNLKVYEAPYKVMIIWLPEKMNVACSNKLLKMIEEPPSSTIFLLISEDRESVLQTIWSRCQPLHIRAIEKDEMVTALSNNFDISEDEANSIAHIANGSYTNALHMIESFEDNRFLFELFVNMMRASVSGNIKAIKEAANNIATIGREMQKSFISYSLKMFREYFMNNLGEPEMVYLNDYEKQFGERFSPYINEKNIEEFNNEFSLAYRQIEQNGNAKIIFLELCLRATLLLRK